jgi:chromate transporter
MSSAAEERVEPIARAVPLIEIMALFAKIGLTSFGGGLSAWIYREVVDRRHWLSEDDFLAGLTLAQILPGANVTNIAIYVGQRLRGGIGAFVAVLSLLLPPVVVVVILLVAFNQFSELAWLRRFVEGVAAGAIGLTAAIGYRAACHATRTNRWAPAFILLVFVAVGVMRWPLVLVVLCVAPLSFLVGFRQAGK